MPYPTAIRKLLNQRKKLITSLKGKVRTAVFTTGKFYTDLEDEFTELASIEDMLEDAGIKIDRWTDRER